MPSSTSPTVVAPSTVVSASPLVTLRSCVGIFTVTDIGPGNIRTSDAGRQPGLERLPGGIDLVGLEAAAHRVEGLQALARDQQDHALFGVNLAGLRQLAKRGGGHPAGCLGEYSISHNKRPDALEQ